MRLMNYINEDISNVNISAYIKLLKEAPNLTLYRGFGSTVPDFSNAYKVDKNRKPKGTDIDMYRKVNKWLQENGFCRRDNVVFCKTHKSITYKKDYFGKRYPIIPIGNFRYTYCKSDDFNYYVPKDIFSFVYFYWLYVDKYLDSFYFGFSDLEDIIPSDEKDIKKYINNKFSNTDVFEYITFSKKFTKAQLDNGVKNLKNMFSNTNIKDCIKNDWEIWIECDEYMIFETDQKYREFVGNYNG